MSLGSTAPACPEPVEGLFRFVIVIIIIIVIEYEYVYGHEYA